MYRIVISVLLLGVTWCTLAQEETPCANGGVLNNCSRPLCETDYCPISSEEPEPCINTAVCRPPRCMCTFNQRLDRETNKCISVYDCPPFECEDNEEYIVCPVPSCIKEQCSDYLNNDTRCDIVGNIGTEVACFPKCLCKKGFFRDSTQKCVRAFRCAADATE